MRALKLWFSMFSPGRTQIVVRTFSGACLCRRVDLDSESLVLSRLYKQDSIALRTSVHKVSNLTAI